jgi:hypothetical protein
VNNKKYLHKGVYRGAIVAAIGIMIVTVVATNPNLQRWRDHIHVHYNLLSRKH